MAEFEKSLERYDVLDRIAVGGMAEVFLAKAYGAHGFEKTLAIKRILPDLARDPEFEERFIAEAKVAVKLSHTNIVQVLDFGRFSGSLFIAMEFVDGLDLAALLRRYKDQGLRVPLPSAFQIAIELARGLDFAHQHGVVHRDVSPSNILLSRAGEVKIADFGIAVAARPHRARSGTGPRKVMGKWRYMSPEQALGEVLDTRSDLFSAAAVMFELFTGEKLFLGDEVDDILKNIQSMPIPSLRSIRPELPARLDEILAGPLARRPSDRPQRAALLVRALTELSYESSIVATSLDVAEAVGLVAGPSIVGRSSLDDMIRAQLGGAAGSAGEENAITREKRQTAVGSGVTGSLSQHTCDQGTGVFMHKVDGDGLSRLEIDETTMAAQPRSRRTTGSEGLFDDADTRTPSVIADVVGLQLTTPANAPAIAVTIDRRPLRPEVLVADDKDPDRHTQVGPPLDESRPLVKYSMLGLDDAPPTPRPAVKATPPSDGRIAGVPAPAPAIVATLPSATRTAMLRRVGLMVAGLLGVAAIAFVLWPRGSTTATPPVALPVVLAPIIDAAPVATTGVLEIDSEPRGAHGTANNLPIDSTPTRIEVPAGVPVRVALELARYQPYVDDRVVVGAGQVVRVRAVMAPAKAGLSVSSTPVGAGVFLDGRRLGETPLTRLDLEPRPGAQLVVSKDGFVSHSQRIDLVFGQTFTLQRELRAEPKFGEIQIAVVQAGGAGWADAYLKGRKIGRASVTDAPLRLPVGAQRLRLVNPVTGAEKSLDLVIVEGKNPSKTARLEPKPTP